jgi:hypothetical protein
LAEANQDFELTIAPYQQSGEITVFNTPRGTQFCMMTLKHPSFGEQETIEAKNELYKQKYEGRNEQIDEIFDAYAQNINGNECLQMSQLEEALIGIGVPPSVTRWHDDLLFAYDLDGDGLIQRNEFSKIVANAWGNR